MQKNKKTLSRIILVTLLLPIFYFSQPQKTEAFWPTFDIGGVFQQTITAIGTTAATPVTVATQPVTAVSTAATTVLTGADHLKKFVLDPIAYGIAKMIIKQLTAQTVNWINSGFKGNPAFVTDPNQFFMDVGDKMAAQVLSNTSLSRLCTPFRAQVRIAVAKNYLNESDNMGYCSLGRIADNFDNFTNNFSSGGWDAFFSVTQNSQNNPYGSYMNTKNQVNIDVAGVGVKYQKQLEQGNGFLSFEKCKPGTEQKPVAAVNGSGQLNTTPTLSSECKVLNTEPAMVNGIPVANYQMCKEYYPVREEVIDSGLAVGDCKPGDKETVTPGSVINTQLQKVLGSGVTQLELANSINQVVSALMTQLFQQVVGGIGKGLRGVTQRDTANNVSGRSLVEQMAKGSPEEGIETTKNAAAIDTTANNSIVDSKGAADPIITGGIATPPSTAPLIDLPSITVKGGPVSVAVGGTFTDPGVIAMDNTDGDISASVQASGVVDTNTAGQYTINYIVINSKGNSATATRTVTVTPIVP